MKDQTAPPAPSQGAEGTAGNVWDEGRWASVAEVTFDFMTRYITEQILASVSPRDKSVLEFGSGTGRLSYLLLKNGAKKVTLVDSSKKAIALSRKLFEAEAADCYRIVESDIFDYSPSERYDVVFSSGLIEHFKGKARFEIVQKHVELTTRDCVILHPSNTMYQRLFSVFPPAVKLYGFAKPFSDEEMTGYLRTLNRIERFSHRRFYLFYSVPVLHSMAVLNRGCDKIWTGRRLGGVTLTHALIKQDPPPRSSAYA